MFTLDNITIKNGKYGVHCLVDKKTRTGHKECDL